MTSPLSVSATTKARDVDIVCCTGCCPCWPSRKGRMEGHSVTHHRTNRPRADADLDKDPAAPKAAATHMVITLEHVRRSSDIITVERTK